MDSEDEMSLEEIINEFIKLNPNVKIEPDKIRNQLTNIYEEYEKIKKSMDNLKLQLFYEEYINNGITFNVQHLYILDNDNMFVIIAKMIYFNKQIFGFLPRKIQIISLLYFIEKNEKEGLIQQINTGEGKSLIISFLAVYIAKTKKKKIDILTSSPILAKRDAIYLKEFYNMCGLSVDYTIPHNDEIFKNIFTSDNFKCYDSDIVYGDALSFEGDYLRTSFMGIKGRGFTRKFECIIIDEIDNIALDNLKNTTELLDSFHGYKFLEYVYLFIYNTLTKIEIEYEAKKNAKNIIEQKDKIVECLYDKSLQEFNDIGKLKQRDIKIFIPNHLENYIKARLYDWCESAFIAKFIFKNNENYIIKKNEFYNIDVICPIDFYNTGVTQENSIWSGLHQFLEIKEGKMLTEENLSSCYISNLSYFNKFITKNNSEIIENNIYGLTGTIGSKYNIDTLKELYKLNVLYIPPFRKSKLIIEKPIIVLSNKNSDDIKNEKLIDISTEWRNKIINKTLQLINSGRSVLIVYQYINEVENMYNIMKELRDSDKIFKQIIKYSRSDIEEESEFLKDTISPRTLIISTNISGRGTDIRISKDLNEINGLHVILTYEPFNERIENQAFGRAARKGQNGSAGKIILCPFTDKDIILKREEREKEESDFLIKVYKYKIETFERMFLKFSKYLENIYKENNIKTRSKYFENDSKQKDQEILLLDIKERWGIFLIENNLNNIEKEYRKKHKEIKRDMFGNIEKRYDIFEDNLKKYCFGSFFDIGNENNEDNNKKLYKFLNALYLNKSLNEERMDAAIEIDENFALGSYMFKLKKYLKSEELKNYKKLKNKAKIEIISKINNYFEKLNELLNNFVKQYEYYRDISLQLCDKSSDFVKQSITKCEIMKNIFVLMEENRKEFNKYIDGQTLNLKFKEITFKNFIKTINKLIINKLDEEYFMDFGFRLFILETEGNDCIIY